jgi:hypothetical protein
MKQIKIAFLGTMMVFSISSGGWAQNFNSPEDAAGTQDKISSIFSDFGTKAQTQIHKLTNECVSEVTQLPADEKTKWCQDQKQKKIAQYQQIQRSNSYLDQQLEELQDDLSRCQYIADSMLIDRCTTFEKNINMNIHRFSDPNNFS